MTKLPPETRQAYRHFTPMQTRWEDNDQYGHLNNAVHYRLVDTAVNLWLIGQGLLSNPQEARIGLVVESGCRYHAELGFPQTVMAGLRIGRIGQSSVRWEIGLFAQDAGTAAAEAHFTHVYVDPLSRRPAALPDFWRERMAVLLA